VLIKFIITSVFLFSVQIITADTIVLDSQDTIIRLSPEEEAERNAREAEEEAAEAENEAAQEAMEAEQEASSESQMEPVKDPANRAGGELVPEPSKVRKESVGNATDSNLKINTPPISKSSNIRSKEGKNLSMKTKSQKVRNIKKRIRTSPGQGAKASDIEVVWGNFYFSGLVGTVISETSILFKDGSVYLNCEIPPTELDVQQSKQLQIAGDIYKRGKWTTWRKSWAGYEVKKLRTDKWGKLEGKPARAASGSDAILNVKYINAGGSQIKGSFKNTITFKPNGRFEMSSFSMQDNSALGGGGSTSDATPYISRVTKSDKHGSQGAVNTSGASKGANGITRIGGGTSSKKKNGSKNTGTYKLDGFRIILEHDNGFVHSELFYFTGNDNNHFIYQDSLYGVPKEDRKK